MGNLREIAEADLATTLESPTDFGLPVDLTDPDGAQQTVNGQILSAIVRNNPDTGEPVIVNNPVVVLRRSTLNRVPVAGEKWHIRMAIDPSRTAVKQDFVLDPARSPEGGQSIGFIRLYVHRVEEL